MSNYKVNELTEEQKAAMPRYVDKFVAIGDSTARIDRDKLPAQIAAVYEAGGLTAPKTILYFGGPQMMVEAATYLILNPKTDLKDLEAQFSKFDESLIAMDNKSVETRKDVISNICYGNNDAYWIAFYSFFRNECGLEEETKAALPMENLIQNCGWFLPYSDVCFVSERPTEVHKKGPRLHNTTGPALTYADGQKRYYLNGIKMKPEYIETPADKLSVEQVMREVDIDVRRELLARVGLGRFLQDTNAKLLDSYKIEGDRKPIVYELYEVSLGDDIVARVLKMDNPSIDAIHVEGVEDNCNTVKEALAWRNGFDTYQEPVQLS